MLIDFLNTMIFFNCSTKQNQCQTVNVFTNNTCHPKQHRFQDSCVFSGFFHMSSAWSSQSRMTRTEGSVQRLTFEEFGKLEQPRVRVVNLEVKLNGLKQYPLQCDHFFLQTMSNIPETTTIVMNKELTRRTPTGIRKEIKKEVDLDRHTPE